MGQYKLIGIIKSPFNVITEFVIPVFCYNKRLYIQIFDPLLSPHQLCNVVEAETKEFISIDSDLIISDLDFPIFALNINNKYCIGNYYYLIKILYNNVTLIYKEQLLFDSLLLMKEYLVAHYYQKCYSYEIDSLQLKYIDIFESKVFELWNEIKVNKNFYTIMQKYVCYALVLYDNNLFFASQLITDSVIVAFITYNSASINNFNTYIKDWITNKINLVIKLTSIISGTSFKFDNNCSDDLVRKIKILRTYSGIYICLTRDIVRTSFNYDLHSELKYNLENPLILDAINEIIESTKLQVNKILSVFAIPFEYKYIIQELVESKKSKPKESEALQNDTIA